MALGINKVSDLNLSVRIESAVEIAILAGRRLADMFEHRENLLSNRKGIKDLVTQADIEAEEIIIDNLKKKFPHERVLSEEADFEKEHSQGDFRNTWIIDPLDGTRNFSIGNPNFVVSIGYVDENNQFSGIVHSPILNDFYIADNQKSFFNNNEIKVNQDIRLDDSIVAFWDKREKDPGWEKPDILNSLRGKVTVLRMFGASALEKSWVASGQVDLYIGNSSSIFGAVAGIGLVRNASGVALNLDGDKWQLGDIGIICGNESLVHEALEYLE